MYGQPKPKPKSNNKKPTAAGGAHAVKTDVADDNSTLSEKQRQQIISMLQAQLNTKQNPITNASSNASWIQSISTEISHVSGIQSLSSYVILAGLVMFNNPMHTWIIDSGATNHIIPYFSLLVNVEPLDSELHLPNGQSTKVTHISDVMLSSELMLTQVLYVP